MKRYIAILFLLTGCQFTGNGWTPPPVPGQGYGVWTHDPSVNNGCNEWNTEPTAEVDNNGVLCTYSVPGS